jgi:AcrR family transcriptional regulator
MNTRMSADDRRAEVIAAATVEFAAGGYAGTSTGSIAQRAGVSQPYLFQLFGTKKNLFLATVRDCFARTAGRFEDAGRQARASNADPVGILTLMGHGYMEMLLADRDLLRVQLHSYAACSDPDVQALVRLEYNKLWQTVAIVSGADPQAIQTWFANGMLLNVIASLGEPRTIEEFLALIPGGHAPER